MANPPGTPENGNSSSIGSMGLHGIWGTLGNATAMLFVCVLLWNQQRVQEQTAREERQLCWEQVRAIRRLGDALHEELLLLKQRVDHKEDGHATGPR